MLKPGMLVRLDTMTGLVIEQRQRAGRDNIMWLVSWTRKDGMEVDRSTYDESWLITLLPKPKFKIRRKALQSKTT